jgi:hypothetical protein
MHVEYYLYQKNIFLALGRTKNKPMTMKEEECEVLERKSLGTIRRSLSTLVDFNISK